MTRAQGQLPQNRHCFEHGSSFVNIVHIHFRVFKDGFTKNVFDIWAIFICANPNYLTPTFSTFFFLPSSLNPHPPRSLLLHPPSRSPRHLTHTDNDGGGLDHYEMEE